MAALLDQALDIAGLGDCIMVFARKPNGFPDADQRSEGSGKSQRAPRAGTV